MQLAIDTELQNGKYRILRVLGQGGFGITYLAENILLAKKVAIKEFFPKDFCGRDNTSHLTIGTQNQAETVDKLKERFLKEARNIAKLDHPGIVQIHDVFEENNTAYYVMDYIDGENLNELVKRNGPLPEDKAVEYIRKVGEALAYIHSRNMTHFDVKPANIVVRKSDDYPILLDFGLSKQYDSQGGATSTLMQGVSNGYSPIELYTPGSLSSFSPQTDVYSLGATLYYLITGKTPPSASELCSGMESLYLASSYSLSLRDAIKKAMTTTRAQRPTSISQWLNTIYLLHSNPFTREKDVHSNGEETIFVSPTPQSPHSHPISSPSSINITAQSQSIYSDDSLSSQNDHINNQSLRDKKLSSKMNETLVFDNREYKINKNGSVSSRCLSVEAGSYFSRTIVSYGIPLTIVVIIWLNNTMSQLAGLGLGLAGLIIGYYIDYLIKKNKIKSVHNSIDKWAKSNPDDPRCAYIDSIKSLVASTY